MHLGRRTPTTTNDDEHQKIASLRTLENASSGLQLNAFALLSRSPSPAFCEENAGQRNLKKKIKQQRKIPSPGRTGFFKAQTLACSHSGRQLFELFVRNLVGVSGSLPESEIQQTMQILVRLHARQGGFVPSLFLCRGSHFTRRIW